MITEIEREKLEKIKMKTLQKYILHRFSCIVFAKRKKDVIDRLYSFFLTDKHKIELELLSELKL